MTIGILMEFPSSLINDLIINKYKLIASVIKNIATHRWKHYISKM